MVDKVTNELILEHLKLMQAGFDRLEMTVRESIAAAAEDRAHIRALMQTTGRHEERFFDFEARLDGIERKLNLRDF